MSDPRKMYVVVTGATFDGTNAIVSYQCQEMNPDDTPGSGTSAASVQLHYGMSNEDIRQAIQADAIANEYGTSPTADDQFEFIGIA